MDFLELSVFLWAEYFLSVFSFCLANWVRGSFAKTHRKLDHAWVYFSPLRKAQTPWCETLCERDFWDAKSLLLSPSKKDQLQGTLWKDQCSQNISTAFCASGHNFFYSETWHPPAPSHVYIWLKRLSQKIQHQPDGNVPACSCEWEFLLSCSCTNHEGVWVWQMRQMKNKMLRSLSYVRSKS